MAIVRVSAYGNTVTDFKSSEGQSLLESTTWSRRLETSANLGSQLDAKRP